MPWSSGLDKSVRRKRIVSARNVSTFYQNKQLELYASKEAKRLTLRQLVFYGRAMDEDRLIKSANFIREELPVRIAHRLRDLQALQYRIVTNEGVAKVYEMYWDAFERFRKYPPVTSLQENEAFCHFLSGILGEHATVIPNLSLGLSLSSQYLPPEQLDSFMRRMLVSRISRRVLAEHHIALSEIFMGKRPAQSNGEPHVGIIFTGLNVRRSVEKCAKLLRQRPITFDCEQVDPNQPWPEVVLDGHQDTKFSYIKEHLEYIVFELLKNSLRATLLKHFKSLPSPLPPIQTTIAEGTNDVSIRISDQGGGLWSPENQITSPADLFSFSHIRNASRMEMSRLGVLRSMSSSREGIRATIGEQISRWKRTENPELEAGVGPHRSFGLGLPMSNIFATYFGGSLELISQDGWGTDVYVRLPKLGTNLEGVEL